MKISIEMTQQQPTWPMIFNPWCLLKKMMWASAVLSVGNTLGWYISNGEKKDS